MQSEIQPRAFDAFEAKLIEIFGGGESLEFVRGATRIGLERQGVAGEITLTLLAQEMRDFCRVDSLDDEALQDFACYFAGCLEQCGASRLRIGPLSEDTCQRLEAFLGREAPGYLLCDAVLSVEPLVVKAGGEENKLSTSLKRALREAARDGLEVSAQTYAVEEMEEVHRQRWGSNRSRKFFEAMAAFATEPYCDCISLVDGRGRILGQQIDFCLSGQRYYYYSANRHAEYPGVGKVLLAESVSRFLADSSIQIYSFGRGGEPYKYRYADQVRLDHYLVGYNINGKKIVG